MAILHVRNVPDELYDRLKRRAEAGRRSISAEIIRLIEQALDESESDQARLLARIRSRRFYAPAELNAPESTSLLRESRER
jgi:plasmid stability protein